MRIDRHRCIGVGNCITIAPTAFDWLKGEYFKAAVVDLTSVDEETLREAERVTRKGITINTFMLDDSPVLRGFVDEMTKINRGRAFYTRPDRLGEYLLIDYVSHRRKRV